MYKQVLIMYTKLLVPEHGVQNTESSSTVASIIKFYAFSLSDEMNNNKTPQKTKNKQTKRHTTQRRVVPNI